MKKYTIIKFLVIGMLFSVACGAQAKKKKTNTPVEQERPTILKDVYMFGIAQNISDSITYFTNITPIKNAVFDKETGFIDGISLYTNQLETHLQQLGRMGYICATFYYKSMKKAERALVGLHKNTDKKSYTHVEPLGDFNYKYASPDAIYRNVIKRNADDENADEEEEKKPTPPAAPGKAPEKKPKKAPKKK